MKDEFVEYLKSIGIPEAIRERIEMIYEFYREICPDEITGVFVTDYIKEDGSREYENLWFFSDKYFMEAKQFITQDNFDIAPIKNRISYWNIRKQDYNFKKATPKSRFYLKISMEFPTSGEFKAAKENCDYLRSIFFQYIKPNLEE
jgi:hypothetical protein